MRTQPYGVFVRPAWIGWRAEVNLIPVKSVPVADDAPLSERVEAAGMSCELLGPPIRWRPTRKWAIAAAQRIADRWTARDVRQAQRELVRARH